jgi:hypothetical protein
VAEGLQEAGISTVEDLKIIARDPESFRRRIQVLAALRDRNEYQWLMLWKALKRLEDPMEPEQSANDPVPDPIKSFVHLLGGGEHIDVEAFSKGLRESGITSEMDLLALSRSMEGPMDDYPFLQEFVASNKFGWTIVQVGLDQLRRQEVPTSVQA